MLGVCCCQPDGTVPEVAGTPSCEHQKVLSVMDSMAPLLQKHGAGSDADEVTICIVGAQGLSSSTWPPGQRDCYCTVSSNGGLTQSTRSVRNDLDVIWSEELRLRDVTKCAGLEIKVWENGAKDDKASLLGVAVLPGESFELDGFNGELQLHEPNSSSKAQSFLKLRVKLHGKDYPSGGQPRFAANLRKADGISLGLSLDGLDGVHGRIDGININGIFSRYNTSCVQAVPSRASEMVKEGDFLVAVNGVQGSFTRIAEELKNAISLDIEIIKAHNFSVWADRKGKPLGLVLSHSESVGNALLIDKVKEGTCSEWNAKNRGKEIRPKDWIIAVNNRSGTCQKLLQLLSESQDQTTLTISRPDTSRTQWWS